MKMSGFYYIMLIPVLVGINVGLGLPMYFSFGPAAFGITGVISIIAIYLFYTKVIKPARRKEWVQENGISSTATVLEASQTGTTVKTGGRQFNIVRFKLSVKDPKRMNPYEASTKQMIEYFNLAYFLRRNYEVNVKIDPENPQIVVITEIRQEALYNQIVQPQAETAESQAAAIQIIKEIEQRQQELGMRGKDATARILKFWDIEGVKVQTAEQQGQLYGAMIEVFSPGEANYTTELKFFASEKAITEGRLANGTSFLIKVDPADKFKVAFWRVV